MSKSPRSGTSPLAASRRALGALLCLLAVAFAGLARAADNAPHALGCRPPTIAEKAQADQEAIVVDKVYLNKFGLDRLNKERAAKGLKALDENSVDLGDDDHFFSGSTRKGGKLIRAKVRKASLPGTAQAAAATPGAAPAGASASGTGASTNASATLPGSVDNSTNIWMPPVGDQGGEGSCASYSSAYYTMTYMVARANNWNVTGGPQNEIFSPQFIYNMINGGADNGSWVQTAYDVMGSHGAPFLSVWPYNGNYTALPTNAAVWRNAIPYRMGNNGAITDLDTAAGLQNLKTMVANGYLVNFCLDIYNWHFTTIKNDPASTADNSVAGWPVCDYANGSFDASGHCMTIVGYNDNVWVDINNNGVVDPGEMGAFKVVNQWGTGFGRNGYAYVAYDAIKPTSAVAGSGTYNNSNREAAFWYEDAYWIQARPAGYKPVLLAQFDLNTADRGATSFTLGYGATSGTAPTVTWEPFALGASGDLSMAGGTTASDGTCVLDYTDIAAGGTSLNWFLDFYTYSATPATVKSFILTDGSGNQLATCAGTNPGGGLPQTVSSYSTAYLWATDRLTDSAPPGAVTDLAVAATGPTSASLTWTQPGNDGMNGVAFSYNLVYSTSPITASNFSAATPFTAAGITPGVPGSTGGATVTGLTPGGTYYFALETSDYEGTSSAISNVPSATLPTAFTVTTALTLPPAVVGLPYATLLQATGGVTPYSWYSALTPYYAENTSGSATLSTGGTALALGQYSSDVYYSFANGFTTPISGGTATSAYVSTGGILYLYDRNSNYLASVCPFNDYSLNISGAGEGVYVTASASKILFRWQAHESGSANSVVFEAILYSSGNVQFNYGNISGVSTPATIGIEPNSGSQVLSARNGATTVPYGSTSYFTLLPSPVPGLSLDPATGILSGTPALTGSFTLPVTVSDSSSLQQSWSGLFSLAVSGSGLEIAPGGSSIAVPMGGSINVPIHLSQAPASPVTVAASFTSGDSDISITGGSSLTFTTANWNTPQQLTLSAPANVVNGKAVVTLSASGLNSVPLIVTETDPAPTLASGPTASPSTVTGTQTTVSALGADNNGASALTYTWSTVGTPPAPVTFTLNNSNAGQNTPAIFTKAGSYTLKVTVTDASGGSVSGTTGVTVVQTLTALTVTPASQSVAALQTQQFSATATDQFGNAMSPTPTFTWAVAGGGAINSSGLFTAGSAAGGPYTVTASTSGYNGYGSVTVVRSPPTISILSPSISALIIPSVANSLVLSATATDALATPTITWSQTSGPSGKNAVFANANLPATSVSFPATGTYVLNATSSDGVLTASQSLTIGVGVSVSSISDADIGSVGATGTSTLTGGTYTLYGAGSDIYGSSDAFNYLSAQISGNATITARIVGIQNQNSWSKAGVMIRQSSDPAAMEALMLMSAGNGANFQFRPSYGASTTNAQFSGPAAPYWVRVVRSGSSFSGYSSPDGNAWTQVGTTQTIPMTDPVLIGLAVTSHVQGTLASGTFDNVSGLPATVTAPQVNPGSAPAAIVNAAAALSGSASAPNGFILTSAWSLLSGPGTALFGNAAAPATTVTLSTPGSYVLSLSGSDSAAAVFQNLAVTASAAPTPPVVSAISNQSISANSSTGPLAFTVGDAQIAAGSLIVSGSSSNPSLLPNSGIVFGGSGGARTVTLTPAGNQSGTATVTLSVYDGTFTTTTSFTLTVTQTFASWASIYSGLGALTAPMNDPLGQGIPNILSYAFGLNPTAQNQWGMPALGQQNGYLTLTYRQNKSAPDLTFIVEATGNIATGPWSSSGVTEISRQDMGAYWFVTDSDSVPMNSGTTSRFLHLKVSMQ